MKAALAVIAASIAIFPATVQTGAIDVAVARSYFKELRDLGALDAGKLWGRRVSGPMMLVDPEARVIVANEPDAKGLLRNENGVWIGKLPPETNAANTSVDFGGRRWSMVVWPVSDNRYARGRLLMHESFHRIQDSLGFRTTDRSNAHLATAEGRIWTRLEWRALTEAVLRPGPLRRQALSDALTFRARRRSAFREAAEDERQLELNEGLAEYTGLVLSGLPRSAFDDRVAVQLAQFEPQESLVRSFAYASGPAYALLLDESGRPWRKTVSSSSDLSDMAREAYHLGSPDIATAESLIERYSGARMVADERAREAKRLANETRLRSIFVTGPRLRLPMAGSFSFTFNPNGATPIQGVGTVYETSRVTDNWGVLEVESGGVLIERNRDGLVSGIVAPKPVVSDGKVTGAGWKLTLSPGWIAAPGVSPSEFVIKRAGELKTGTIPPR
jgi:hypothetical protein